METTISLWLDRTSEPGDPRWIVSRDQGDSTETLIHYPRDAYRFAKSSAISKGKSLGLRVVELSLDGTPRTIYDPNPVIKR